MEEYFTWTRGSFLQIPWSQASHRYIFLINFLFFLHFSIEKDVLRTDRRQQLFSEEDSPMSKRLFELLVTYSFYDFDIGTLIGLFLWWHVDMISYLGYVQGMSDLLAPILSVIQDNEAEAFWCFVNLMKKCVRLFIFYILLN